MNATRGPRARGTLILLLVSLSVVACGAGLGLLELGLALLMAHPPSQTWQRAARAYYYWWERRIVQFLPECSRYDADLFYTLRPGRCRFENREYSVDLLVNSRGFRADERALESPTVVVLGDSYAMGWGVAQESTFASRMERQTGLTTLNTGQSSYGTARELLGLRRVDLAGARYLVIQYSGNDFSENAEYVTDKGRLPIRSRAEYDSLVSLHLRTTRYYPGKYIRRLLPAFRDEWLSRNHVAVPEVRDYPREAETFLQTLLLSPVRLDHLKIMVLEMRARARNEPQFADHLREESRRVGYPPWIRNMVVLDVSGLLSQTDYFSYDEHINASGHAKLADLLVHEIQATEATGRSDHLQR
jgi:hypothetical protein